MTHAVILKEEYKKRGEEVLQLQAPFNEVEVFTEAKIYMTQSFGISGVHIFNSADDRAPDPEKIKATAVPQKPVVSFILKEKLVELIKLYNSTK